MKDPYATRNRYTFGLGTIGRDMLYTLVSTYLNFYLTEALNLPDATLWGTTIVILIVRIYDCFNDPFMGIIVDNTKSRFGKFKPWIAIGAVLSAVATVLFFTDFNLSGASYILAFTLIYLFWEIAFTANDIAYWSMLPALSVDQKTREKIGSTARIFASLGMFLVVVGITPMTEWLGRQSGSLQKGYMLFSILVVVIMLVGQCITLIGVKEPRNFFKQEEVTHLRDMFRAIGKNDQLLYTALSMSLFMIGYCTTTGFGQYYFKYVYKDSNMYSIFGIVLGVTQLTSFLLFPVFRKHFTRRKMYIASTIIVVLGYIVFFFSPVNMIFITIAGVLLFAGQGTIQILMLVFLTDTIEYGQWKLGRRNESITFSIQPFINKIGGAIANAVVGATVIVAGISAAKTPDDVTPQGLWIMKIVMMIVPLILIIAGFLVYRSKYKIDDKLYEQIVAELTARGDLDVSRSAEKAEKSTSAE